MFHLCGHLRHRNLLENHIMPQTIDVATFDAKVTAFRSAAVASNSAAQDTLDKGQAVTEAQAALQASQLAAGAAMNAEEAAREDLFNWVQSIAPAPAA